MRKVGAIVREEQGSSAKTARRITTVRKEHCINTKKTTWQCQNNNATM